MVSDTNTNHHLGEEPSQTLEAIMANNDTTADLEEGAAPPLMTRREKVLQRLFPRIPRNTSSKSLCFDEDSQLYQSIELDELVPTDSVGDDNVLTCCICLDKIGESQGVSGVCKHLCTYCSYSVFFILFLLKLALLSIYRSLFLQTILIAFFNG